MKLRWENNDVSKKGLKRSIIVGDSLASVPAYL